MCVYENADPLDIYSNLGSYVAIIVYSGSIINMTKTNPLGN